MSTIPDAASYKHAPLDPTSRAALAASDLEYRLVDTDDETAFSAWAQVDARGFLDSELTDEQLGGFRDALAYRRTTGVYDARSAVEIMPVATTNSWVADLTLPGGTLLPSWAISSVTVASTHRRRGVARALLEGELRTAAALGVPMAMLTVSEATIYGRFGFAPAAFASAWEIETKRARWIGPVPGGKLDFIPRERFRDDAAALHERVRPTRPGEIAPWPGLWTRMAGLQPGGEEGKKLRAIRYSDDAGETRGVAIYKLSEEGADFTKHELTVEYLLAETPDAHAALWRFVLEHDLVSVVKAYLQPVDEPLRWMIADQRAAKVLVEDHQWLRILDVPAVLSARRYAAAGRFVIAVTDYLGFTEGTWLIEIDPSGSATVSPTDEAPSLRMGVNELSALTLGGVSAAGLAVAGRIQESMPGAAALLDPPFGVSPAPLLSLWY